MRILMTQERTSSFFLSMFKKNHVYETNDNSFTKLFESFIDEEIAIELKGIKIPSKVFFENVNNIIDATILVHNDFFVKEQYIHSGSGYIDKSTYNIFNIEIYGENYAITCFEYNIQEEILQFNSNHWCLFEEIADKLTNNILELLNLKN